MGRLGARISAGVVDAAVSSASGFVLGLAATRLLDEASLGTYAVFFSAYTLAMVVPSELVLAPAEIAAIELEEPRRAGILRGSVRSGGLVATLAALVTLVSIPVVMGTAHPADIPAFAIPTVIATVFGALEDHARRLLHLAGRSREAVISAFVMLFVSVVAVVGLAALPMVRAWVPITALAIANISSLATSAFLVRGAEPVDRAMTAIRALAPVGRFLLFTGVVPAAAYFVATAMVNRLAGPDQLGYSEAARVVSQPILVLGVGLLRVLGPRAMEAGRDLDRARGRRVARTFNAVMIGGSAAFAAVVAVPWALNPFGYLVPTAYVVPWLVVVSVIANAVIGVGFAARSEMLGGGRAKNVARGEIGTTVVGLVFAATAAWTQAFARPLSRFGSAVYRSAYYQLDAARMYSETTPTDAAT